MQVSKEVAQKRISGELTKIFQVIRPDKTKPAIIIAFIVKPGMGAGYRKFLTAYSAAAGQLLTSGAYDINSISIGSSAPELVKTLQALRAHVISIKSQDSCSRYLKNAETSLRAAGYVRNELNDRDTYRLVYALYYCASIKVPK